MLRHFEERMRTSPKVHALTAIPYTKTELQFRFAWCMIGLTRAEYDSEDRKILKEQKVFLKMYMRDLMTREGAAVACAKRRDALCFIRFMLEQISKPALNTCVKMLKEGDFTRSLGNLYQSKPMQVNMKESVELEPMKKIDEIRRFSNKDRRLTKEPSEYCGLIRRKFYSYVFGIIGMAYNPFINEDIRDCSFDYGRAVLLRFWLS